MHSLLLTLALTATPTAPNELDSVYAQVTKQHASAVERLRKWVALPAIAAEGRNTEEGVKQMIAFAKEAGFQHAERIATDGKPGVFATLDAGAAKTVGLYFMYDVKQFEAKEWASPPLEGRLVNRPGLGKVMIGRGVVNQKGPEMALLTALMAFKAAGQKLPVNLVMVAEGEEEIGSPHIGQIVHTPRVEAALTKAIGIFMPSASQSSDGSLNVVLGAKGVVELELVSSGAKWGRGPSQDVHSFNRARLDSPAFHLVQALNTLVDAQGDPAIEGFAKAARAVTFEEKVMLDLVAKEGEALEKAEYGVTVWAHDAGWRESLEMLVSRPTVNIEGLVAGYTGPGGKTVLPTRAVAKLDLRLVPNMTFDGAIAALKAHLANKGFGDIEVNVSGGYDPTATAPTAELIQKQVTIYKQRGFEAPLFPRAAGSYPGFVFTNAPLSLAAGHFGLGHGGAAHAPDEFYLIESTNPKVAGFDDAVKSFVDYLVELGR